MACVGTEQLQPVRRGNVDVLSWVRLARLKACGEGGGKPRRDRGFEKMIL
jgi:hypothetical protein